MTSSNQRYYCTAILLLSLVSLAINGCGGAPTNNSQNGLPANCADQAISSINGRIEYEIDGKVVASDDFEFTYAKVTNHNFNYSTTNSFHNGMGFSKDYELTYVNWPALEIGWKKEDRLQYMEMLVEIGDEEWTGYTGDNTRWFDHASAAGKSCAWLNLRSCPPAAYPDIEAVVLVWKLVDEDLSGAEASNITAWKLATFPIDKVRDGAKAVRLAYNACKATDWETHAYVDTLAAAYAETGDFKKAVEYQEQAIELLNEASNRERSASLEGYQKRLELFQNKKPYRVW